MKPLNIPTVIYLRYMVRWHVAGRRDLNRICPTDAYGGDNDRMIGGSLW